MFLICGEVLFDVFITEERGDGLSLDARPGGSPYNVALGLSRMGLRTEFFTGLSNDLLGCRLLGFLQADGVGLAHALRTNRPTALSIVGLDAAGVPDYAFYPERPAYAAVTNDDLPILGPEIRAIHFGSVATVLEPIGLTLAALAERESPNRLISYDPNVRLSVVPDPEVWRARLDRLRRSVHLIKVSNEDLNLLYPGREPAAAAQEWLAEGVHLVVVTRGAEGACAWTHRARAAVPGRKVEVVDTVGAGDSFQSALLAGLAESGRLSPAVLDDLSEAALSKLLAYANDAAAITCSRRGADMPFLTELASPL